MSQPIFEDMYAKLYQAFMPNLYEVTKEFGPEKELDEIFDYLWNFNKTAKCIEVLPQVVRKDDKKADEFRAEGDKFFKKKIFASALECYNKSIVFASQLESNAEFNVHETEERVADLFKLKECKETKSLSLAYANRSAVLYELQNYDGCLLDISRAIHHGYPLIIRIKLLERLIKCYLGLRDESKAKLALDEGLLALQEAGVEERIILGEKKKLESLQVSEKTSLHELDPSGNLIENLYASKNLEIPKLLEPNEKVPSLTNAASIAYSDSKGRYLKADRDIMPGEIVAVEKAYVSVNLPPNWLTHCSYCLLRTLTPIPCSVCPNVVFCSRECRSKAKSFHDVECSILPLVSVLDNMEVNAILALRYVSQMPISELKSKVSLYEESNVSGALRGFNDENIYSSEDYRTIFYLESHRKNRSASDVIRIAAVALFLVKILLHTDYFRSQVRSDRGIKNPQLSEDINFIGRLLIYHTMTSSVNAFSVSEMHIFNEDYPFTHCNSIGGGVYSVLSLANHSCNASVSHFNHGTTKVARTMHFIPKGGILSILYGSFFFEDYKGWRHTLLKRSYYFVCDCEACTQDWPLLSSVPERFFVKCPCCSSNVELRSKHCPRCRESSSVLKVQDGKGNYLKLSELFSKVLAAVEKYDEAYEDVCKGNVSEQNIDNVINALFYVTKYAVLPVKLMVAARAVLVHCYSRKGACYYSPVY